MLWNWTDQGIRNAKDAPQRYESFKKDLERAGAKSIGAYYTMGEYDGVVILEAPNDEVVMKIMLATASLGNVRTKTLKAFPHAEGAKIMENL
ncbi:MAG TPA: GYD domain-containing protein [Nitrososphaeraceae archaeon]|jgi:uncharacterized protein with GYD domain|nr:GYD domain-containing protein [Nitrososphaeraceae archaeon]